MKLSVLIILAVIGACRAFNVVEAPAPVRTLASLSAGQSALLLSVEEKLTQIHYYNLIGQKQLHQFDELIPETDLESLYESQPYLKMQAVRSQVEEIEDELLTIMEQLNSDKTNKASQQKRAAVLLKIKQFSLLSKTHTSSLENISEHLGIYIKNSESLSRKEIENQMDGLKDDPQFQVFEKNIEHLSYMLESKADSGSQKFAPSVSKNGNITGNEFPSKVWSLTFDDGPRKETSPLILMELQKRGLSATFFQLTRQAQENSQIAAMIREGGMEIASHSYTHKELTKVGSQGLEREITTALKDLKKVHGTDIKFFRLPYGAGVSTPSIRAKIAENGLIHVFWNIDTLDWMAQTPEKIVERTKALMKKTQRDAGVILFHDIHERTTLASPIIMDYLKQDNRRVCTLNEIVTQMNKDEATVCPAH